MAAACAGAGRSIVCRRSAKKCRKIRKSSQPGDTGYMRIVRKSPKSFTIVCCREPRTDFRLLLLLKRGLRQTGGGITIILILFFCLCIFIQGENLLLTVRLNARKRKTVDEASGTIRTYVLTRSYVWFCALHT